jgi:hypothetical protein
MKPEWLVLGVLLGCILGALLTGIQKLNIIIELLVCP